MMRYSSFWLLIFILLISCNSTAQKKSKIIFTNNTHFYIDSIKIESYGVNISISHIPSNREVVKEFDINYKGKYEGAFTLTVYIKDTIKHQSTFGYFSNSDDFKSVYRIIIDDGFKLKEF